MSERDERELKHGNNGHHSDALGEAMNIGDVATMLGCSPWTVRQTYLRQGLPHVRASAAGKIVFFKTQVIAWIIERQHKKGGYRP